MAEISESRILPPAFIEAAGKTYLGDLATATGQFKTADLSKVYGPQFVAGQDPLTQQAVSMVGGLGAYAPYLQAAGAATGPTAYQAYMSPYQQDVIDTTLKEFDIQAQKGLPGIGQAAYQAGAFGGARQGVAEAEYGAASARNRAALQAQLLQQGFGQANQLAAQQFGQQMNLAGQVPALQGADIGALSTMGSTLQAQLLSQGFGQAQQLAQQQFGQQMNLAGQVPALQGADIGALSTMGGALQQQRQAELAAQQQLNIQNLNQPLTAAQQYGSGVTSLIAGYPGKNIQEVTPSPSGLSSLLGAGSTLAGIYGALK